MEVTAIKIVNVNGFLLNDGRDIHAETIDFNNFVYI